LELAVLAGVVMARLEAKVTLTLLVMFTDEAAALAVDLAVELVELAADVEALALKVAMVQGLTAVQKAPVAGVLADMLVLAVMAAFLLADVLVVLALVAVAVAVHLEQMHLLGLALEVAV
jgi:hypothetical protein